MSDLQTTVRAEFVRFLVSRAITYDCPWRRTPQPIGAPYCSICDDHSEAVHAGYGDTPCTCGDRHPE